MQVRVLGCSGSIAAGSRTTSFLLDDDVLIDAGTGVGDLTLEQMGRIDHIFISHVISVVSDPYKLVDEARRAGVYVPRFYKFEYFPDNTIADVVPLLGENRVIAKLDGRMKRPVGVGQMRPRKADQIGPARQIVRH